MAGRIVQQLAQLLAAAAVVATAFATSLPPTHLIDPGSPSDNLRDQFSRLTDATALESPAGSIVHVQVLDAPRARSCSGFFISAHLVMTTRRCLMTPADTANAALNVGARTIRGLELLVSQADLDFSLLWANTDVSQVPINLGTPTSAVRARLIDRLPLLNQANPAAATELRAALK